MKNNPPKIGRREFSKLTMATAASTFLTGMQKPFGMGFAGARNIPQDPILKISGFQSTSTFTGDEPDPNHERFWDIEGYIRKCGGLPAVSETQNVVVIGGGLSGLTAAYYLKALKPLVLEQASQFGGNARGEAVGSNIYSLGPAYISIPEQNSASYKMLNEIGVLKYGRLESAAEKEVFLNGKVLPKFWSGAHENPAAFEQMKRILTSYEGDVSELNKMTVNQWIQRYFPQIPKTMYEYFQYYAWSSFGATLNEVAAGEFLSWQASEQHGVMVFPGGNSLISQGLYQNLKTSIGPSQLRTKSAVLKVIPGQGYADVVVEEAFHKLKTIRTRFVVMAVPKFVAKNMIPSLPVEQIKAMSGIEYRSYMVGNVTLKRNISSKGYDLYCLNNEIPPVPSSSSGFNKGFTDVIFANWAQFDKTSPCTLTFYKAFPYQGARQFLLNPSAHNKHRDFLLSELQAYYPELGITSQDLGAVRMTLWGHAVPVCRAGLASSPTLALASRPVGNIYFANQDNMASPSYESAEESAREVATHIMQAVRRLKAAGVR